MTIELPWGCEYWLISNHKDGDCLLEGTNKKLSEVYPNYPLLIKIIEANKDLSIQVHPDVKSECWYILDCKEDGDIIVGHNAQTKQDFINCIKNNLWDSFLRKIKIKKDDIIQIDPGTVHAIKGGTLILETQQTSNTTYRVYDYGSDRELHIDQALETINFPSKLPEAESTAGKNPILETPRYTVYKIKVDSEKTITNNHDYMNFTVIEGSGEIKEGDGVKNHKLEKFTSFIVPKEVKEFTVSGNLTFIASHAN